MLDCPHATQMPLTELQQFPRDFTQILSFYFDNSRPNNLYSAE